MLVDRALNEAVSSQLSVTGRLILLLLSPPFLQFSSYSDIPDPYVRQRSRVQCGFLVVTICSLPVILLNKTNITVPFF